MLFGRFLAGEDDGGGAIVDAGCIASGDSARIAHNRPELGQILQRCVGSRMLVFVDFGWPGFAARHFDGDDFLGEVAVRRRFAGALLRAQRKRILILARDLKLFGDILAGLRH